MTWTTRKMSDKHEAEVAERMGGRITPGSGNQWRDQTDGKMTLDDHHYAFAWDGKATLGKSIGVTREMWAKLVEQCGYHMPALPLRFYRGELLNFVDLDLVVIELETFAQLVEDANAWRAQQ